MPFYTYRRQDGSTLTVEQRMNDKALRADPETGEPVERVMFAPAIGLKGRGFHNTDPPAGRRRSAQAAPRSGD